MKFIFYINLFIRFILLPYLNRLKLGEGGLVFFNLLHSCIYHSDFNDLQLDIVISFLTMCSLYGLNDFLDRKIDLSNPKKNHQFVILLNNYPIVYILQYVAVTIVIIVLTYFQFGVQKILVLISLILVNAIYSLRIKGIPIFDVLFVCLWGGLFTLLAGPVDYSLAIAVGLMTGIAHIYQVLTDRDVDAIDNIRTSAVVFLRFEKAGVVLLSTGLFVSLMSILPMTLAATSFFLIIVNFTGLSILTKWHLSRIYFAFCWLSLLFFKYKI
jgi:4-hydroxybenzoate polyprenyltransferase